MKVTNLSESKWKIILIRYNNVNVFVFSREIFLSVFDKNKENFLYKLILNQITCFS